MIKFFIRTSDSLWHEYDLRETRGIALVIVQSMIIFFSAGDRCMLFDLAVSTWSCLFCRKVWEAMLQEVISVRVLKCLQ